MEQIPTKPYLIRAIHEWCVDNGLTPYLAVSVDERVVVPAEHVRNGEIVLNVSTSATSRLLLGNELIEFQARFGGVVRDLSIPVDRVSAIYARENGQGMAFEVASAAALGSAANSGGESPPARERSLSAVPRLVEKPETDRAKDGASAGKGSATGKPPRATRSETTRARPTSADGSEESRGPDGDPPQRPRGRGKPKLTRIK